MVKVRDIIEAVRRLLAGYTCAPRAATASMSASEGSPDVVTIPGKPGDDMPEGTLTAVCRKAGISKNALKGRT